MRFPWRRAQPDDAWTAIAVRAQRLARLQLVVLMAFVVVATTMSALMGQHWREVATEQHEITRTLEEIEALEHAAGEGVLWSIRSPSDPLPATVRDLLRNGSERLSEIVGDDSTGFKDSEGAVVANIARALERAETVVIGSPASPRPEPAGGIAQTVALLELTEAIEEWIHHEEEELGEAAAGASGEASGLMLKLLVAIGVAATVLFALWGYLARLRGQLVRSLGLAATRLEQRAERDQLTGLLGHATFKEQLGARFTAAREQGQPMALALFDLDSFKALNDTYGHQFGDKVVAGVGEVLAKFCRDGEAAGRIGGDEFGLLIVDATEEHALQAAERVRTLLGQIEGVPAGLVNASCGVCSIAVADDADELFRLADGALYWAKQHGRARTVLYSPHEVWDLSAADQAIRVEREVKLDSVLALARAIDARDPSTLRHSERVANMAALIARELGWSEERIDSLVEAALIHDIGKIGVPDSILFKPEPLTVEEYETVKGHSALGAQILSGLLTEDQVKWVRGHHERLDGLGYPDGLSGDEISDGALILALADAWDAMTADRPYSSSKSVDEAIAECRKWSGAQFSPAAVVALERVMDAGPDPDAGRLAEAHARG